MENKNFDKYDRRLKEQLKGFSDRPVPPEIRKDFAASVAKKIGEGQGRWVMPGFVPGLAIFIVALIIKYAINIFKDVAILGKPPDILTPIPNFVFNMLLVFLMTPLIEMLMAINGA